MEKKLKMGIITHHYIKNYGAFLQAYALQETIRDICQNANVEVINYINKKHYFTNLRPLLLSKPKSNNLIKECENFIENKKKLFRFYRAKKHLNISPRCRNANDINNRGYDIIFIGSDEVWNINSVSCDRIKFAVDLDCSNIVSYAPSVGTLKSNQEFPEYVSEGIKKFRKISVRDVQTRELIEQFYNYKIERVLDPTFLIDFTTITKKINNSISSQYILVYQCELDDEQIDLLKAFAVRENLLIIGAGNNENWFDKSIINIGPFDWINLFNHAHYILTGTFHGTIFAIKSKVKFVAYPTLRNRVEKIKSLLEHLKLESRYLDWNDKNNICDALIQDFDYDVAYNVIYNEKQKSINYIRDCIDDLGREQK